MRGTIAPRAADCLSRRMQDTTRLAQNQKQTLAHGLPLLRVHRVLSARTTFVLPRARTKAHLTLLMWPANGWHGQAAGR